MSFIYSQALVAASSLASCLDTDASAPSSGSPTPKPCLWHDKTMAASRLSRFGMMCSPLTDDHGRALLTSWLAAFPVRTSVPQGGVPALTASAAACGTTWPGSLARYDRATSSWKTAQCSLLGDLDEFSATWPRWGLMRDGACWEQPTLAPRTSASGSGLWDTPCAMDAKPITGGNLYLTETGTVRHMRPDGKSSNRGLEAQVTWPTPIVCGNYNRKGLSATSGDGLATKVMQWPTPRSSDGPKGGPNQRGSKGDLMLSAAVHQWPTPVATMHKGWSPNHNRAATDDRLDYSVERESYQPGQPTPPMRLNPQWVEWLMGWPIGHTDLKPLETAKFQEWRQQHGSC